MVIIVDKLNFFETNYINCAIPVLVKGTCANKFREVNICKPRKESSCANTRIICDFLLINTKGIGN